MNPELFTKTDDIQTEIQTSIENFEQYKDVLPKAMTVFEYKGSYYFFDLENNKIINGIVIQKEEWETFNKIYDSMVKA
jgi:hypothetical protein